MKKEKAPGEREQEVKPVIRKVEDLSEQERNEFETKFGMKLEEGTHLLGLGESCFKRAAERKLTSKC